MVKVAVVVVTVDVVDEREPDGNGAAVESLPFSFPSAVEVVEVVIMVATVVVVMVVVVDIVVVIIVMVVVVVVAVVVAVLHVAPNQPTLQVHSNPLILSAHVPLFLHGLGAHSSSLVAHVEPDHPASQLHVPLL